MFLHVFAKTYKLHVFACFLCGLDLVDFHLTDEFTSQTETSDDDNNTANDTDNMLDNPPTGN